MYLRTRKIVELSLDSAANDTLHVFLNFFLPIASFFSLF